MNVIIGVMLGTVVALAIIFGIILVWARMERDQ